LQPRPQSGSLLAHAMLHVDPLVLIAREGGVEPAQQPIGEIALELVAIEEVEIAPLIAEEQPVAPACADRAAFLEKGAKRRDAGPWADHDDRRGALARQAEAVRGPDEGWNLGTRREAFGQIDGGKALAQPATPLIAHGGDGEVHFARHRLRR